MANLIISADQFELERNENLNAQEIERCISTIITLLKQPDDSMLVRLYAQEILYYTPHTEHQLVLKLIKVALRDYNRCPESPYKSEELRHVLEVLLPLLQTSIH